MTIDSLPITPSSTIRSDEVARFNRLAATWWNRTAPMRPLHVVNELRLGHVLQQIAQRFGRPVGALQGLRIADVGCGAGLMCEPLAARGALVVGIDAAANNIAAARLHSKAAGLHIAPLRHLLWPALSVMPVASHTIEVPDDKVIREFAQVDLDPCVFAQNSECRQPRSQQSQQIQFEWHLRERTR